MTLLHKGLLRTSSILFSKKVNIVRSVLAQSNQQRTMTSTSLKLNSNSTEIFELRTYEIYPHKLPEFLELTKTDFSPRVAQSKPLGYWVSELGGLNQVVHIWPYDNIAHRAKVRADLGSSAEWKEKYISKALTMFKGQENSVLQSLTEGPINNLKKDCPLYELHFYQMKTRENEWAKPLSAFLKSDIANPQSSTENSSAVMAFKTICGPINCVTILWQHPKLENFHSHQRKLESSTDYNTLLDQTKEVNTKVLSPFIVNHWN